LLKTRSAAIEELPWYPVIAVGDEIRSTRILAFSASCASAHGAKRLRCHDCNEGRGCQSIYALCQSPYVFNCKGQLIAEESIVAKISNSGEKAGFSSAFDL